MLEYVTWYVRTCAYLQPNTALNYECETLRAVGYYGLYMS